MAVKNNDMLKILPLSHYVSKVSIDYLSTAIGTLVAAAETAAKSAFQLLDYYDLLQRTHGQHTQFPKAYKLLDKD